MGLDQYLFIKRKNVTEYKPATGFCGGLFGIAPVLGGEEIGYWRKDYELDEIILNITGYEDDEFYSLTEDDCNEIIKKVSTLNEELTETIKSLKEDKKNQDDDTYDDMYDGDIDELEWQIEHNKETIKVFEDAIEYFNDEDFDGLFYHRNY